MIAYHRAAGVYRGSGQKLPSTWVERRRQQNRVVARHAIVNKKVVAASACSLRMIATAAMQSHELMCGRSSDQASGRAT